jgi:hypothetical protein
LNVHLGPFDLKRLESYANNLVDYHVIMDLLPIVSSLYFEKRLGEGVRLGAVQSSILLALGLQRKTIEAIEVSGRRHSRTCMRLTSPQEELNLPVSQALALFVKSIRKICKRLMDIQKSVFEAELPPPTTANVTGDQRTIKAAEALGKMKPVEITITDELREAGNEVTRELREKQREMINSLDLSKYVPSLKREGFPQLSNTQADDLILPPILPSTVGMRSIQILRIGRLPRARFPRLVVGFRRWLASRLRPPRNGSAMRLQMKLLVMRRVQSSKETRKPEEV